MRTENTSCPANRNASTVGNGKFSSASNRIRREWVGLVLVGEMAGVRQASENILVRQARIVGYDVGFRLSGCKQVEDELNCKPCAADNRLAREHFTIDKNTIRPGHVLITPRNLGRLL